MKLPKLREKFKRLGQLTRRSKPALLSIWNEIEFRDFLIFGGLLLLAHGIAMVYRPAAWVVFGFGVFAVGYFGLPNVWGKRDRHDQ